MFQSVLDAAGRQAASIQHLWWFVFWVTTAVSVIVLSILALAVAYGRRRQRDPSLNGSSESVLTTVVSAAVAVSVGILFVLLIASVWTAQAVSSLRTPQAVSISVTGHQWWWEVEYEDAIPSRRVTTANEIHIPTGRPVVFKVTSRDVIHSFWAPNLQGKRDLIPGYVTAIWFQADRPGTYRGQCAEFCGLQHAHMAFEIVAESEVDFERWLDAERQLAEEPQTEAQRRGQTVFMTGRCSLCHRIRGTSAYGTLGPDLTHLASRSTLGAGTLPNTRGHLAGWVVDSQAIKPGNKMPPNVLAADDLVSLLEYLQVLR